MGLETTHLLIMLGSLIVFIAMCVNVLLCCKIRKNRDDSMEIKNAVGVVITIGRYDKKPANPSPHLAHTRLQDLAVEKDHKKLGDLLGPDCLNYEVYPNGTKFHFNKTHWTEEQLIGLLEDKAKYVSEQIEQGVNIDGMVIAISGHGMHSAICTSDYQLIDKVAIHRIFSAKYPNLRGIPRLFIFDCCEGSNERFPFREVPSVISDDDGKNLNAISHKSDTSLTVSNMRRGSRVSFMSSVTTSSKGSAATATTARSMAKDFALTNVARQNEMWVKGEHNPDHMLVELHAANAGFQAKLNADIGSYLISGFCEKVKGNLGKEKKYLCELVDEIQKELADLGKQQIVPTYHNKTRYITFERNEKKSQVEMMAVAANIV